MRRSNFLAALAAIVVANSVEAQAGPAAARSAAPSTGWRAEFLQTFDQAAEKYIRLAEATPAEKFTWRPAEGVRSIAEVYLHISSANYGFAGFLGAAGPDGIDVRGLEKSTTAKAEVIKQLRASFAHFRAAVAAWPEADTEKLVRWFGPPQVTARHFLYLTADHTGEHLGQSIAYARSNGVVPPWSVEGK